MPDPGSSAGVSDVEEAKAEVKRLVGDMKQVETEIKDLKKDLGIANIIKPKSIEELQEAFPNVLVEWENKSVDSLVKEIRSWLKAEIAKKEDEKKRLQDSHTKAQDVQLKAQDVQLEKEKQVTEEKKQVTAEKEKELVEAQARQGAKRPREGHTGTTPHPDDKRPREASPTQLPPPSVTPTVWRVTISVPGGVRMLKLRSGIISLAQKHVGYDGQFVYEKIGDILTEDSPLKSVVHFRSDDNAGHFVNEVEEQLLKRRGMTLADCPHKREPVERELAEPVEHSTHYKGEDSPEDERLEFGNLMPEPLDPSSTTRTTLEGDRKIQESLGNPDSSYQPELAHIIEKQFCKDEQNEIAALDGEYANRVVLNPSLHQLYDGRGAVDGPVLSIYCDDDFSHLKGCGPKLVDVNVKIHVFFPIFVGEVKPLLRESATQVVGKPDTFSVRIKHPHPWLFKELLNIRYNKDFRGRGCRVEPYTEEERIRLKCLCHTFCCEYCGALRTTRGELFTTDSLDRHKRSCGKKPE